MSDPVGGREAEVEVLSGFADHRMLITKRMRREWAERVLTALDAVRSSGSAAQNQEYRAPENSQGPRAERKPCRHDSLRGDGTLDDHCLRCGIEGYWHDGHRHDRSHPSGKILFVRECHVS